MGLNSASSTPRKGCGKGRVGVMEGMGFTSILVVLWVPRLKENFDSVQGGNDRLRHTSGNPTGKQSSTGISERVFIIAGHAIKIKLCNSRPKRTRKKLHRFRCPNIPQRALGWLNSQVSMNNTTQNM
jgi:hypothetical protein